MFVGVAAVTAATVAPGVKKMAVVNKKNNGFAQMVAHTVNVTLVT